MTFWKPAVLCAALALAACGAPASNTIGPSGGTATAPVDGPTSGAALNVPANALTQSVDIAITVDSNPGSLPTAGHAVSPVLVFAPDTVTFASPATITIPTTEPGMGLFVRPIAGGEWTQVANASYDSAQRAMTAQVTKLGEFVATSSALACTNSVPTDNFCSTEGCNFAPVSLPSCDAPGTNYDFFNQDYCSSQLTVLVVAAGWCVPCMQEAPMIEELITQGYKDRGVRVITALFQNANYTTPTVDFCNQWKDRYGLTSHMAIDPQGLTQIYYPSMAFPANLIINRDGQIVYRAYGTSAGLQNLIDQIEAHL